MKPKVTVLNNSIQVKIFDLPLKEALKELCNNLITVQHSRQTGRRPMATTVNGRFYYLSKDGSTARFPITYIHKVLKVFAENGFPREKIDTEDKQHANVTKLTYKMYDKWKPRKYQTRYIKAISGKKANRVHLVDLDMGYGKTLIGSFSVAENGFKLGILVRSKYVKKWYTDIRNYIKVEDDEILIMKGLGSVTKIENMTKEDIDKIKIVIMSIRTISLFIEKYLETPTAFEVTPMDLLEKLGIGTILNDESHQEFEALTRCIMFLNPHRLIGLSATMESDDRKLNYIYSLLFPPEYRAANMVEYVKYIHLVTWTFNFKDTKRIQHKTYMGYNHNTYEKSLFKLPTVLSNYLNFVCKLVEEEYIKYRVAEDKDKCILFFSTIDMCTLAMTYLKRKYPKLDIRRYTGGDPYENILEADIATTTPGSAGTAVDIPNLITAIQTVGIGSKQLNEQSAGRLRELDGKVVRYVVAHALNISSHVQLYKRRRAALKKRIVRNIDKHHHDSI